MTLFFLLFLVLGVPFLWIVGYDDIVEYYELGGGQAFAMYLFGGCMSIMSIILGIFGLCDGDNP